MNFQNLPASICFARSDLCYSKNILWTFWCRILLLDIAEEAQSSWSCSSQARMIWSCQGLLFVLGTVILAVVWRGAEAVNGCITVQLTEGKQTICSNRISLFTKVPSKLPPGLVKLEVTYQNIHALTAPQLKGLPHLAELNLDENKLSSIEPDAFQYVPKLENLTLRNNLLILGGNSFPSQALTHIKNLKSLNLHNNPLGFVPDLFFQPLSLLQRLHLSRASSGFRIQASGLAGLSSLEILDISSCHLQELNGVFETSLRNMQLQQLSLYDNPWRCDCGLKWLHSWLLGRRRGEVHTHIVFTRNSGEQGVLQPRCASPPSLKGRTLLPASAGHEYVATNELTCAPRIVQVPGRSSSQIQVEQGSNLSLSCDFLADPPGRASWSRNGMVVQRHWQQTRGVSSGQSPQSGHGHRTRAWLSVARVSAEDAGLWRCLLVSPVGHANASFSVRVRTPPPAPLDLGQLLKYIGIGAVTLVLLLVLVGVAIYCLYGFRVRPFVKPGPVSSSNGGGGKRTRRSRAGVTSSAAQPIGGSIRPTLITGLAPSKPDTLLSGQSNQASQQQSGSVAIAGGSNHVVSVPRNNSRDDPKCLLLPSSPTMLFPLDGGSSGGGTGCPLHGLLSPGPLLHHESTARHRSPLMQPHTLPRKTAAAPCPLHGHILASLGSQHDEDPNNHQEQQQINPVYSIFFSPRHSQPSIHSHVHFEPAPNDTSL